MVQQVLDHIDKNHTNIYYKPTHTRYYKHCHSQTPWPIKTAWTKALFHRDKRICNSEAAFGEEIQNIDKLMS